MIPGHDGFIVTSSKEFASIGSHENRVLKLGTSFAIRGDGRPIISPRLVIRTSQIDHGFHCKDMTHLHNTLGLVFVIMGNIGSCMKERSNTMSTIRPYNAALVGSR